MNGSQHALRPEAGPVPLDLLNQSQMRTMNAIVMALRDAAAQAATSQKLPDLHGLVDPNPASRLFFVSGQPGSGKSSLYLTLRAILSKNERYDEIRKEYRRKIPDISELDGATLWLEQIDLEVAGDTGENLLAAVLVRIFAALDESSVSESKACQEAMDKLNDLSNDIGIAWDGNLLARAPSLDPQSYSQEVMGAQRARLDTNKRLFSALNTLLSKKCYACNGEKIFILPIDDFYLKPAVSLELLRLLRMISVPSLFFLIMGDIKTMEALFFEKALADWTAVAGPQVFASLDPQKKDEVLSRVREMKARYLRKLLPAGQRATIEWTTWDEALRYRPTVTGLSYDPLTLSSLLSDISIESMDGLSALPNNLLNYLVGPPYLEPTAQTHGSRSDDVNGRASEPIEKAEPIKSRFKTFREAYSALLILDATPREVADLWMCLFELREREGDHGETVPRYLWTMVDFALLAIEEQDFLTEQQQDSVRYAFPTSHKDDLLIETGKFKLAPKVSPRLDVSLEDIFVRKHLDWKLGISNTGYDIPPEHTQKHLPPRTAAWIILLHDLAWNWQQNSLTQNLVHGLLREIKSSDVLIGQEKNLPGAKDSGWAWYIYNGKWVHFPFPCFGIFRQLDRFLAIWSEGLRKNSGPLPLDVVVDLWAYAAWIATGPEDRYIKFVEDPSCSKKEKADLNEFRVNLFQAHEFLGTSVS